MRNRQNKEIKASRLLRASGLLATIRASGLPDRKLEAFTWFMAVGAEPKDAYARAKMKLPGGHDEAFRSTVFRSRLQMIRETLFHVMVDCDLTIGDVEYLLAETSGEVPKRGK